MAKKFRSLGITPEAKTKLHKIQGHMIQQCGCPVNLSQVIDELYDLYFREHQRAKTLWPYFPHGVILSLHIYI